MSRTIDADALIDNIKTFSCIDCERRKGMKNGKLKFLYEIGDVPCRACDVADMIDTIDEAPTVGEWISVKDNMPKEHPSIFAPWYGGSRWKKAMWRKESDSVLLAYKTPDTGAYVIKEGRTHDGKFYSGNITLDNNCEVTHWMEMPEPPKEEKDDA